MKSIFRQPGHAALEFSPHERVERVLAATPQQHAHALLFLSGYAPEVFDTALEAAELVHPDPDAEDDSEPYCASCGTRVGIFLRVGLAWHHYEGDEPGGPFELFDPGHEPVLAWRPVIGIPAVA